MVQHFFASLKAVPSEAGLPRLGLGGDPTA
jgi:hypothetical protein